MSRLVYSAIASLDGFVADRNGNFEWAAPDEEVHAFVNDLERPIGTYLYGRRMYDVMRFWETALDAPDEPAVMRDFAEIWQAADKIVFSTTLEAPVTARTRIERAFDANAISALKSTATCDIAIAGPHLAAQAIRAGLVDEYHMFLVPVIVGDGNSAFPRYATAGLALVDEHRFESGVVYLHYRAIEPMGPRPADYAAD